VQPAPVASQQFVQAITVIENKLDNAVDEGCDDTLFLSSYLQGHFAVIARQLEMNRDASLPMLDEAMQQSLNSAFANNELEQDDQERVYSLWQTLLTNARP